ncbi:MAG: DinB family protein, partial [Dehalococcoidales bacterium]
MDWRGMLTDEYGRVSEYLEYVLDGLSKEDLDWRPKDDCNSIGWLVWHLTRQQDLQVSGLMGEEQLWIRDGWHSKFNMPADEGDVGFGHTTEQVAAFKSPDVKTM